MSEDNDYSPSTDDNSSKSDQSFVDKTKTKLSGLFNSIKTNTRRGADRTKAWSKSTWISTKKNTKEGIVWLDNHHIIQFLLAILISTIGIILAFREFDTSQSNTIWMFVMVVVGIILGIVVWIYAAQKIFGKLLYYVVEHKFTRKIIAGGSFSYFEFRSKEDISVVNRLTEPISIFISSLIAFLVLATTSIGLVRIFSQNLDTSSPILWGILSILTPIFATPIIPIAWVLDDARVKAWNAKNQTTWMVSKKYRNRLNSFIALGAVVSNLRSGIDASSLVEQLQILFGILRIGALIIFISLGFFIMFYYVWYRNYLRKIVFKNLDLPCYEVILEDHDISESIAYKQIESILIAEEEAAKAKAAEEEAMAEEDDAEKEDNIPTEGSKQETDDKVENQLDEPTAEPEKKMEVKTSEHDEEETIEPVIEQEDEEYDDKQPTDNEISEEVNLSESDEPVDTEVGRKTSTESVNTSSTNSDEAESKQDNSN